MELKKYEKVKELTIYFNEIKKYKCLSRKEEALLAKKIKNGDTESLNKLVNANLRFVVSIAKKYAIDSNMPLTDLISEGNIGLIKAAQKFDEAKDVKFISYAVWWIKSYIQAYITSYNKDEEYTTDNAYIFDNSCENDDDGDNIDTSNTINEDFENKLTQIQDKKNSIEELLNCLQEREIKIIMMYYGFSEDNKEKTLDEISKEMNLTKERVRQIKDKAMVKLRAEVLSSNRFYDYKELIK